MDIKRLAETAYSRYMTTLQSEGRQVVPWEGLSGIQQLAWMNAAQEILNADFWESVV
jgi:hypothetical protein